MYFYSKLLFADFCCVCSILMIKPYHLMFCTDLAIETFLVQLFAFVL